MIAVVSRSVIGRSLTFCTLDIEMIRSRGDKKFGVISAKIWTGAFDEKATIPTSRGEGSAGASPVRTVVEDSIG